jgi:protein TonB
LALSLALHLALLAALPVSFVTRSAIKVPALDVVLMPQLIVPAPAPPPVMAPRAAPPRRTKDAAKTNKSPEQSERIPEFRPVPKAAPHQPPLIAAPDTTPATAPLAQASIPAKPNNPQMPRKNPDAVTGRGANDIAAPSFNAAYLLNPAPLYPIIARRNGEQGTVTLKVLVTPEGKPESVSIDKSSGSAHLDSAALETVRSWRFAPARRGTQPVEAWMLVPIVFRLDPVS